MTDAFSASKQASAFFHFNEPKREKTKKRLMVVHRKTKVRTKQDKYVKTHGEEIKSGPVMVLGRSFPSLFLSVHITPSGNSFSLNISTFIYFNTLLLINDF